MFFVRLVAGLALLIAAVMIGRGARAEVGEVFLGDPNAPVTIIEYASLDLPALRRLPQRDAARAEGALHRHRQGAARSSATSRSTRTRCGPR